MLDAHDITAEKAAGLTELAALEALEEEREDLLEDLFYALEDSLLSRASDADFAARPLDEQVAELAAELELPAEIARQWRDLPDPPQPLDPLEAVGWHGSR